MNEKLTEKTWSKNVILVDGDYIDQVAFNLIVNFERMLERRIPKADLAHWLVCVALDGNIAEGEGAQVILLHTKSKLENFMPADYTQELDGKAFNDRMGEFCISSVQVEKMTTMEDLFMESMRHLYRQPEVKDLMLISNDRYLDQVLMDLHRTQTDKDKVINVFTMQPVINGSYNQQILGFSLMAAMGIKSEEINKKF
jgi:hypothetical protein